MQKQYLIDEIKYILENWGDFGTREVEAESSPYVDSRGNLVHLAERFNDKVTVIVYNKDVDYHHLVFNDIKIRVSKDSNIYDLVTIYNLKRRINY